MLPISIDPSGVQTSSSTESNVVREQTVSRMVAAMRRTFAVVPVFLLCAAPGLQGQIVELPALDLTRYEQVRLWAPGVTKDGVRGKVIDVDSLRLILHHDGERLSVPIAAVERADVLLGTERLRPALVGLVAGAVIAGIGYSCMRITGT